MKLIHKDPQRMEVRVAPENLDDLWHLHNLIDVGDVVKDAAAIDAYDELVNKGRIKRDAVEQWRAINS